MLVRIVIIGVDNWYLFYENCYQLILPSEFFRSGCSFLGRVEEPMHLESQRLFSDDLTASVPESLVEEVRSLRLALRDSRERQRRGALESARRIFALTSEVTRLENLNSAYRRQLESMVVDEQMIELALRLVQQCERNRALRAACRDCSCPTREYNRLFRELMRLTQGVSSN